MKTLITIAILASSALAQVSSYIPSTRSSRDPNFCKRVLELIQANPGAAITAQNDGSGGIMDCDDVDLQIPDITSTIFFGGGAHGSIRTSVGFHLGDRDRWIGENSGHGGNSVSPNTGTNFMASSTFPTMRPNGTGITATGRAGASTIDLTLSTGGPNLIIGPVEQFMIEHDATEYTFTPCKGLGCAPGSGKWYVLASGSTFTFQITPALNTSPSNADVKLVHGLIRFGEQVHTNPQAAILSNAFLNGDSMQGNSGIGYGLIAGQETQENSRAEDVYVRNISQAIRIVAAHRSGTWRNLNAAYTNDARGCPTPGEFSPPTIPLEVAPYNTTIDGFTLYVATAGPCTPRQMIYGGIHVTDGPYLGNGPLHMTDLHFEMNGDQPDGSRTGDGSLIDSTSGSTLIDNITLCPKASACLNGFRVAKKFRGYLRVANFWCNDGTTNAIADEVNSNVLPCDDELKKASGYYEITLDGTAQTNLGCAHMTNGWCFDHRGWRHFRNGTDDTIVRGALLFLVLLIVTLYLIVAGLAAFFWTSRKS